MDYSLLKRKIIEIEENMDEKFILEPKKDLLWIHIGKESFPCFHLKHIVSLQVEKDGFIIAGILEKLFCVKKETWKLTLVKDNETITDEELICSYLKQNAEEEHDIEKLKEELVDSLGAEEILGHSGSRLYTDYLKMRCLPYLKKGRKEILHPCVLYSLIDMFFEIEELIDYLLEFSSVTEFLLSTHFTTFPVDEEEQAEMVDKLMVAVYERWNEHFK